MYFPWTWWSNMNHWKFFFVISSIELWYNWPYALTNYFFPVCYCRDKLWAGNSNNARVCWLIIFFIIGLTDSISQLFVLNFHCYGMGVGWLWKILFPTFVVVVWFCLDINSLSLSCLQECPLYPTTCSFCTASCVCPLSCANSSSYTRVKTGFFEGIIYRSS